jgi:hypothetical protein
VTASGSAGARSSASDVLVARVDRRARIIAIIAVAAAWLSPWGSWREAAAVGAGALLAVVSFWAIRSVVTGATTLIVGSAQKASDEQPAEVGRGTIPVGFGVRYARVGVVLFVGRTALLAGIAYVMIERLRLPPVWLLGGASVTVLAVAGELLRGTRRP